MPSTSSAPAVSVMGVSADYGADPVLQDIGFDLTPGELLAVVGPSGCGKTTLLRCLAGFERITDGRIQLAGRVVALPGVHVAPHRRHVAVVPQDGALFPHLTVAENVAFGLTGRRGRSGGAPERHARVRECLELVGLAGLAERMPHELSGGQQQRVALARALAPRPPLILLDEPFSALDAALRTDLRRDVRAALKEAHATAVLVTHDQAEALSVADRVAAMRDGRMRQVGTPDEVYAHPADAWVAGFVGEVTLVPLNDVAPGTERWGSTALGSVALEGPHAPQAGPGDLVVARPEHVRLDLVDTVGGVPPAPGVDGVVEELDYRGHESLATVRLADGSVARARLSGPALPPEARVRVRLEGPCAVVPGPGVETTGSRAGGGVTSRA